MAAPVSCTVSYKAKCIETSNCIACDFSTQTTGKSMSTDLNEFLKSKMINGWRLFWLITGPISLVMVLAMIRADLSTADGVSSMIQLAVRCAVPWLFVAFAASSVQVLFPGVFSRWLLRNRSYIGLSFAAAMGWQLTFILWLVNVHTDYYVNEVYVLSDVVEGVVGYSLLIGTRNPSNKP